MTEEAKVLSRLRKKRSADRNVVRGLITKAMNQMAKGHDANILKEVRAMLKTTRAKEVTISATNDEIVGLIDEDEIEKDVDEATAFEVEFAKGVGDIEEFLEQHKQSSKAGTEDRKKDGVPGIKLPKLNVKGFTGEPTDWQQFSETFKATVGTNTNISNIEKFSYLKGYLGGEAAKCIDGVALTEDNYVKALNLLEERYGNKQLIIMSHVHKLLKLERVTGRNVQEVRSLYDQIEGHVRSLGSLDIKADQYGPMLLPIILERLPEDIKLYISRKLGNENWKIEEFLQTLKEEISARECCNFMKSSSKVQERVGRHITTEALMTGTRSLVCAFCSKGHFHDKCTVVTDPEERKQIARRDRLCY